MPSGIWSLFLLLFLAFPTVTLGAPNFFTFEGHIEANGAPVNSPTTFQFQVASPTGCVLYQENQIGVTVSQGDFAAKVGQGSSASGSFASAFSNSTSSYTGVSGSCPYSPSATDSRLLKVYLWDGTTFNYLTQVDIGWSGVSLDSNKLEGKSSSQFIQTTSDVTQANANSLFAPSVFNNLLNLSAGNTGAITIPYGTAAQRPGSPTNGMLRYNSTSGNVEVAVGGSWNPVGSGVNSISAGDGTIIIGGTAAAPTVTVNVGTAAGSVAAGDDARIVGAIQNKGNTPSIQTGGDSAKPVSNGSGRLYISSDGQRIYRDDNSVGWSIVGTRDYNDLINTPSASSLLPSQTGNSGKFLTTNGTAASWANLTVPWSSVTSTPTTLAGYNISDAMKNAGGSPGVVTAASAPSGGNNSVSPGTIYVDSSNLRIYRDSGFSWDMIATSNYLDLSNRPTANTLLPSQLGNAGRVLTTDGTNLSWINSVAGESTSVSNVGTGRGVFRDMTGAQINLRSILGTTNQINTVQNANDITLSLPQNIDSGASPSFTGLTLSGLSTAGFVKNNASGVLSGGNSIALGTDVSGSLPIANGGTNSSTALNNNRIMVSSGGAIVEAPALSDGQLLIGRSGLAPVAGTLTGTANQINITNGAGSIVIGAAQNIGTSSTPTFGGMTLNGTLKLNGGAFGTLTMIPNASTTSYTLTWPNAVGAGSLVSDASGNLSWTPVSGGTVTSVSVASANGFAGTVATNTTTPAITISTSVTGMLKGNGTAISAATSGTDYAPGTSSLSTGILKSTTSTGVLSIATAADIPDLSATYLKLSGGTMATTGNISWAASSSGGLDMSNSSAALKLGTGGITGPTSGYSITQAGSATAGINVTTTGNQPIVLDSGIGDVKIGSAAKGAAGLGTLKLNGGAFGTLTMIPNGSTTSYTLTWPNAVGAGSLVSDASGHLSWTSITATPGGSANQVQYNNGSGLGGSANFIWDFTNSRLGIGSASPAARLDVSGPAGATLKIVDGGQAAGKTLISDNLGVASWGILGANGGGTGLSSAGASGNVLYSNGSAWVSNTPDTAGLVDKGTAQTITANKTFNGRTLFGGSISPVNTRIYVTDTWTSPLTTPQSYGVYSNINSNLATNANNDMTAAVRAINTSVSGSTGGYVVGMWSAANDGANGTQEIMGTLSDASFWGTISSTLVQAVKAQATHLGSSGSTVTDLKGVASIVSTGNLFDSNTGRTVTNAYGIDSRVSATAGNTLNNAFGLYSSVSNAGTIGNAYGLYVGTVSGTNAYGVFVNNSKSYFGGNVGILSTAPSTALDVNGTISTNATYEGAAPWTVVSSSFTIPDTSLNIRRFDLQGVSGNVVTITLPAFTSPAAKVFTLTVFLRQDATGGKTVSFQPSASIAWDSNIAPTISTTGGKVTILQFTKASDDPTWYGSMVWKGQ